MHSNAISMKYLKRLKRYSKFYDYIKKKEDHNHIFPKIIIGNEIILDTGEVMKKTKTVSVLFIALVLGLSMLLSGYSFGSVEESIDTTPTRTLIVGEGRYEYHVITKGTDGKYYIRPVNVPFPQVGPQNPQPKGGK